jgi:hypothetical protein
MRTILNVPERGAGLPDDRVRHDRVRYDRASSLLVGASVDEPFTPH